MDFTSEIFNLLDEANGYKDMDAAAQKNVLRQIDQKWDALPDGKQGCNEKSMLAIFMFNNALEHGEFPMADKWVEVLLDDRKDDPGQVGMYRGSLAFEQKDYTNAYKYFKMAWDEAKERPFKGSNPQYLELVKNPSKFQ